MESKVSIFLSKSSRKGRKLLVLLNKAFTFVRDAIGRQVYPQFTKTRNSGPVAVAFDGL